MYIHHIIYIYIYTLYCLFVSRVFRVFYPVERDEASIPGRCSPSRLSCYAVPATELSGDRSMLQDTQIYIYIYIWLYIYISICGCLNKVLPENCQKSSNLTLRKLNDDEWWASQGEKMRWTYHMALYRNGSRSTRILGHSIFKTNPHETPWNQLKHVETTGFYTQPDAFQGTKMCPIHGYNCAEWTWMTAFSGPPNNHHGSFQPLLRSLYPLLQWCASYQV